MSTQIIDADETRFERIPIGNVLPDPNNPRQLFDTAKLQELARSIDELGQIEPVEVRPIEGSPCFMLVAGERRWRAIGLLADGKVKGIDPKPDLTIDCIVKVSQDDATSALRQLVENLQREDLDPIEEARGIARLAGDEFGMTGKDIATKIGRNPGHVTKRLKLLELPPLAQAAISSGDLSIDEGIEVVKKFGEHPDLIDKVIKNGEVDRLEWALSNAVRLKKAEDDVAATLVKLKAKGTTVKKAAARYNQFSMPEGWVRVTTDSYRAGKGWLVLDDKRHAAESCHAVIVVTEDGRPPQLVECCSAPARHGAKGESDIKAAKRSASAGAGMSTKDKAERAKTIAANKARRIDQPRRDEFIAGKVTGRVLPTAAAIVAKELVEIFEQSDMAYRKRPFARACRYFGHPIEEGKYGSSKMPAAIRAYIAENDTNLMRFAHALVIAADEGYEDKSAPEKDGVMAAALDAWAYDFSDQERIDFGLAKPKATKALAKKAAAGKTPAKKAPAA